MDSLNNIYHINASVPYKRYIATVPSAVSGRRMSMDGNTEAIFIICKPDGKFSYETSVLEIYSQREDAYIKQRNKGLFSQGLLAEYSEAAPVIEADGSLTDQQIQEIASTPNVASLTKKLQELNNYVNASRVLATAKEIGRPEKTLALIQKRVDELR